MVEEVLSTGLLRLMPLLVVVVEVAESFVGFFSACSFAWSFFQLLDRSVVGAGMLMVALLLLLRSWRWCIAWYWRISLNKCRCELFWEGLLLAPRLRFPARVRLYGRNQQHRDASLETATIRYSYHQHRLKYSRCNLRAILNASWRHAKMAATMATAPSQREA